MLRSRNLIQAGIINPNPNSVLRWLVVKGASIFHLVLSKESHLEHR